MNVPPLSQALLTSGKLTADVPSVEVEGAVEAQPASASANAPSAKDWTMYFFIVCSLSA